MGDGTTCESDTMCAMRGAGKLGSTGTNAPPAAALRQHARDAREHTRTQRERTRWFLARPRWSHSSAQRTPPDAPTSKQHGELGDDHQVALVDARRNDAAAGDAPGLEAAGGGDGQALHVGVREPRAGQLEGHARGVALGAPQEAPM